MIIKPYKQGRGSFKKRSKNNEFVTLKHKKALEIHHIVRKISG